MKKTILIVGLGKMGEGIALNLLDHNWRVIGYNRSRKVTERLAKKGLIPAYTIKDAIQKLSSPRLVWIMVPSGKPIAFVSKTLRTLLSQGDTVVDGGNSYYKESIVRARTFKKRGIDFVDVGVSGGPEGARHGACMMVGGSSRKFKKLVPLFRTLTVPSGFAHFEGPGAGHFVKMVHNGIEYGMMQAIAEGFSVMKKSKYEFSLKKIAEVYNHGSVIESRLIEWLSTAYKKYGDDLKDITTTVSHSGEGQWTVDTAKALKEPVPIIKGALDFRKRSRKKPSYTGKVLSAMRNQFGGHDALK